MRKLRILDFDIENRPISYGGNDFTFGEITAIAWCWVGDPKSLQVRLLGRDDPREYLREFGDEYLGTADIGTGHYCRNHDLPAINGERLRYGLPPLPETLTVDTKNDLTARGLISHSQENLAAYLGLKEKKYHMTEMDWREANRLTPAGIEKTKKRALSDVIQHMALRKELVRLDHLGPPKTWRP